MTTIVQTTYNRKTTFTRGSPPGVRFDLRIYKTRNYIMQSSIVLSVTSSINCESHSRSHLYRQPHRHSRAVYNHKSSKCVLIILYTAHAHPTYYYTPGGKKYGSRKVMQCNAMQCSIININNPLAKDGQRRYDHAHHHWFHWS